MLEVKPVQTKDEQKALCSHCGINYNPETLAYAAWETETFLGMTQFRILDGYAVLYDIRNKTEVYDLEALILLGRAALNFIDLCGIKSVVIEEQSNNLPQLLEATEKDGVWRINLEGYFISPCQRTANKKVSD